jgi:hypothetical protein
VKVFRRLALVLHVDLSALTPVYVVDAAHCSSGFKVFTMSALDNESRIVPFAVGFAEEESEDNWANFFLTISKCYPMLTKSPFVCMSDRGSGLIAATKSLKWEGMWLVYCMQHILRNLNTHLHRDLAPAVKGLVLDIARTTSVITANELMAKLEETENEAFHYLAKLTPSEWMVSACMLPRHGVITSNSEFLLHLFTHAYATPHRITHTPHTSLPPLRMPLVSQTSNSPFFRNLAAAESLNALLKPARGELPLSMLDTLFEWMNRKFAERAQAINQEVIESSGVILSQCVQKEIVASHHASVTLGSQVRSEGVDVNGYAVMKVGSGLLAAQVVQQSPLRSDLRCDCEAFFTFGLPCSHLMAAAGKMSPPMELSSLHFPPWAMRDTVHTLYLTGVKTPSAQQLAACAPKDIRIGLKTANQRKVSRYPSPGDDKNKKKKKRGGKRVAKKLFSNSEAEAEAAQMSAAPTVTASRGSESPDPEPPYSPPTPPRRKRVRHDLSAVATMFEVPVDEDDDQDGDIMTVTSVPPSNDPARLISVIRVRERNRKDFRHPTVLELIRASTSNNRKHCLTGEVMSGCLARIADTFQCGGCEGINEIQTLTANNAQPSLEKSAQVHFEPLSESKGSTFGHYVFSLRHGAKIPTVAYEPLFFVGNSLGIGVSPKTVKEIVSLYGLERTPDNVWSVCGEGQPKGVQLEALGCSQQPDGVSCGEKLF